jgi:hypothetical protein
MVFDNRFRGVLPMLLVLWYCGNQNEVKKDRWGIRDRQDVNVRKGDNYNYEGVLLYFHLCLTSTPTCYHPPLTEAQHINSQFHIRGHIKSLCFLTLVDSSNNWKCDSPSEPLRTVQIMVKYGVPKMVCVEMGTIRIAWIDLNVTIENLLPNEMHYRYPPVWFQQDGATAHCMDKHGRNLPSVSKEIHFSLRRH